MSEELYRDIGAQKLEDVKTAYERGWIDFEEFVRDLDEFLEEDND